MSDLLNQTLGKYRIVARLGRGGMARVYKAYQPGLDRYVAVKVLHSHLLDDKSFIQRFEREATAVARLRHPNIVQVFDFDVQDDLYYMVMEFIEGPTLKHELEERLKNGSAQSQPFKNEEVVHIITSLAEAIDYAHSRSMIHRDLKPGNIMLTPEGQVLLTDFGLARLLNITRQTESGAISGTPAYMSPEQGQGKQGDERSDLYSLGIVLYELITGRVPFENENPLVTIVQHTSELPPPPSQFIPHLIPALELVILHAVAKNPDDRYQSGRELAQDLQLALGYMSEITPSGMISVLSGDGLSLHEFTPTPGPLRTPTPVIAGHPYRGLFAFQEDDATFFYGREAFTERQFQAIQEKTLLTIVGPSGSGKSSVVFAGLIPRLRQDKEWLLADFRPGARPVQALAESLLPLLEPNLSETDRLIENQKLAAALASHQLGLDDVVNRILSKNSQANRLLLVIDQFEELYTLCNDATLRRRFLDLLIQTVNTQNFRPRPGIVFVLTLRADFWGQALAYRPFADLLQDASLILGPMNQQELGQAIANPAGRLGITFEPGLTGRILHDVGDEPGNLPLLEFALTLLWERRVGRRLTHAAYEVIGRVEGALARYADQVYDELPTAEQDQARRIFMQMVRPGQQTEDTRRVTTRQELGEENWDLVQKLANARLVVTGRDPAGHETVEIVHEALIRNWSRLQEWLNGDRAFRIWQERLRVVLRQWQNNNQDEGSLLRGLPLAEAEQWLTQRDKDLNQIEIAFIRTSINLREQERQAREQERQAREQERQSRERLQRWATRGLTIGLVLAVILAILAISQWRQATIQSRLAEEQIAIARNRLSRLLANQALTLVDSQLDLALLLSAEANQAYRTFDARSSLLTTLLSSPEIASFFRFHQGAVNSVAFSPNSQILASADQEGVIALWDVATGQLLGQPLTGHRGPISSLAFSNNGLILASAGNDQTIRLWDLSDLDVDDKAMGQPLVGHSSVVRAVAFAPDGQVLVSAGADKNIIFWNIATGEMIGQPLTGHTNFINSLAFSPDGQLLASAGNDEVILLWDMSNGPENVSPFANPLTGHTDWVNSVVFSPDGQMLASTSNDRTVRLWDVATGRAIGQPLAGATNWVRGVGFTPDGRTIIADDGADGLVMWDIDNGAITRRANTGYDHQLFALDISPDGQLVASGHSDGLIVLWRTNSLPTIATQILPPQDGGIWATVSPDLALIATANEDGEVVLWDMSGREVGRWVTTAISSLTAMAFSPDHSLLIMATNEGPIQIWDTERLAPAGSNLVGHSSGVRTLAFTSDGRTLASGDVQGIIFLWDMATLTRLGEPIFAHGSTISDLIFVPDNKTLVSASWDLRIIFWDVATHAQVGEPLIGHSNSLSSLAVSHDGQWLAAGNVASTIFLRDIQSRELIGQPLAGQGNINALAFSPDGRLLATGNDGGKITLWDLETIPYRQLGQPMYYENSAIESMVFSEDGRTVVVSSRDGSVVLWEVDLDLWFAQVCRIANRNLNETEWELYFGDEPYRRTCP